MTSNTSAFDPFIARLREFIPNSVTASANRQAPDFNTLAGELFALQFKHNSVYRKFCQSRGIGEERIAHWSEIPAVPASAFKEYHLSSLPVAEQLTVFHSSGTTGHRSSRHFHNPLSLSIYEASLWTWFATHLLPPEYKFTRTDSRAAFELLILSPRPEEAPHSSLVHMFEHIRQRLAGGADNFFAAPSAKGWRIRAEEIVLKAQRAKRPVLLLGTAFSFVHLLDWLAEKGERLSLPEGSRVMETGGYKGQSRTVFKAELYAMLAKGLGVPEEQIVTEYGMSELSSQAYDHVAGVDEARAFSFPPWARAVVISPENGRVVDDGETGLLRIYDLANVFSVMAIQTEDLAIRRGTRFELIGRAEMSEARGCSLLNAEARRA